jgi:hypothetical protein
VTDAAAADKVEVLKNEKMGPPGSVDRPFSTGVNSCAMKRCIIRCHVVEDFGPTG